MRAVRTLIPMMLLTMSFGAAQADWKSDLKAAAKQQADIEGLITQGCNVILVVAFDSDAILPAFQAAADAGVKMISYDVLVEHPDAERRRAL